MKVIQDCYKRSGRERAVIPWWYRFAYSDYCRACDVYYPILINYIVRYGTRLFWWAENVLWWVGLIDVPMYAISTWSDFWRIKTH